MTLEVEGRSAKAILTCGDREWVISAARSQLKLASQVFLNSQKKQKHAWWKRWWKRWWKQWWNLVKHGRSLCTHNKKCTVWWIIGKSLWKHCDACLSCFFQNNDDKKFTRVSPVPTDNSPVFHQCRFTCCHLCILMSSCVISHIFTGALFHVCHPCHPHVCHPRSSYDWLGCVDKHMFSANGLCVHFAYFIIICFCIICFCLCWTSPLIRSATAARQLMCCRYWHIAVFADPSAGISRCLRFLMFSQLSAGTCRLAGTFAWMRIQVLAHSTVTYYTTYYQIHITSARRSIQETSHHYQCWGLQAWVLALCLRHVSKIALANITQMCLPACIEKMPTISVWSYADNPFQDLCHNYHSGAMLTFLFFCLCWSFVYTNLEMCLHAFLMPVVVTPKLCPQASYRHLAELSRISSTICLQTILRLHTGTNIPEAMSTCIAHDIMI